MKSFVTNVKSPVGLWSIEGTQDGVISIHLPHDKRTATKGVAPAPVAQAATQVAEYFAGLRQCFSVTFAPAPSTVFQRDVWDALRAIPFGQVRTYAEIAGSVNRPRAHRAVGNANHANPWPIVVATVSFPRMDWAVTAAVTK